MAYQGPPRTIYLNQPFAILDDPNNLRNFLSRAGIRTDDVPAGPPNSPDHGALNAPALSATDQSSEICTICTNSLPETQVQSRQVHITTSIEVTTSPAPLTSTYQARSHEISASKVAGEEEEVASQAEETSTHTSSESEDSELFAAPVTAGPNYIREIVTNFRIAHEAMASILLTLVKAGAIEDDTPGNAEQALRACTPSNKSSEAMSPRGGAMLSATASHVTSGNSQQSFQRHENDQNGHDSDIAHSASGNSSQSVQGHETDQNGHDSQVAHSASGNSEQDLQRHEHIHNVQAPRLTHGTASDSQQTVQHGENSQNGHATPVAHNVQGARTNAPTAQGSQPGQDREDEVYFTSWGNPQSRNTPASMPRTVILSDVPSTATPAMLMSTVYCGAIERFRFTPGESRAFATFTTGQAAKRYFDVTANGVHYCKNNVRFTVSVDISKDLEPVSSRLRTQLECGATRVVVIKQRPQEYTGFALKRMAGSRGRAVEKLLDRNVGDGQGREVVFRFLNVDAAVAFLGTMKRDEDFMEAAIMFGEDPCEKAVGVHYD